MVLTVVSCISFFFFSSRRRHTRFDCDWSSDVCSSDLVAEIPATGIPVPLPQLEWRELDVGGENVLAVGGERGIENRGNSDVEPGHFRKFTVLGSVEGALEVVNFGADVDAAG